MKGDRGRIDAGAYRKTMEKFIREKANVDSVKISDDLSVYVACDGAAAWWSQHAIDKFFGEGAP